VEQLRHRADHGDALGRLPAPSKGLLHPRAWDFVFSQIRISLSTSALACTRGGGSLDTRSGLIVRVEDCEHVEIVYAYPVDDEEVAA
jgi:hypothetical protein